MEARGYRGGVGRTRLRQAALYLAGCAAWLLRQCFGAGDRMVARMKRLKCVVAYDGTDFSGFQVQPDQVTVQGEIEAALQRITGEEIQITDRAVRMPACMLAARSFILTPQAAFPLEKWRFVLNNQLPDPS